MKECKDLGLKLCYACENQLTNKSRDFYYACIVQSYFNYLQSTGPVNKILLIRVLTRNTILASTGVKEYISYYHLSAVIKEYYPQYADWFEKMLVLK